MLIYISVYFRGLQKACHDYDCKMLAVQMKDKIKCSKILKECYGRKQYSDKLITSEVREYLLQKYR